MKKPNKICSKCRKITNISCVCPPKKAFEGISRDNQHLYNSTKWRNYSKALRRKNPLCDDCLIKGISTPSQVVDHVNPISKGGEFWAITNHRCLCHKCHNRKTGKSR